MLAHRRNVMGAGAQYQEASTVVEGISGDLMEVPTATGD
jgi:hypothetical protein